MHLQRSIRFRRKFALAGAAALVLGIYQMHAQAAAETPKPAIPEGIHIPERRIEGFIGDGADRKVVYDTLASIRNVEESNEASWVSRWNVVAEAEARKAEALLAAGNKEKARDAFFSASNYFIIAGMPEYGTPAQKAALARHAQMYEKGGALMDPPLEVVPVTVRGQTFKTYFHRPKGVDNPPLILWTGGTDKFKGHYYQTVKRVLGMGYALAMFDLPGTGENRAWPITPDGEFVHRAVLDKYASRKDIDASNIYGVGVSFGGYYAIRMAALGDPRLRAYASLCPLVHQPFNADEAALKGLLQSPERGTVAAFAERARIDPKDTAALARFGKTFDLVPPGIVTGKPTIPTPLLVVNGGRDVLSPISDLKLAADSAKESELWVLGMADHCFPEYMPLVVPDMIEWFEQYSSRPD